MTDDFELVVAENHRLLSEVKQLRARVAAYESSRWWRLHPGLALRKAFRLRPPTVAASRSEARYAPDHRLIESFRAEVLAHGIFSQDWFTGHIPSWEPIVRALERKPSKVLEVGSFEGLSAAFLLWRLPEAQITCVDTFAGSPEHRVMGVDDGDLEHRFDHNVALVDASRVRKVVGRSSEVLIDLLGREERFDLVYVDASHLGLDVLVDGALGWRLVNPDGFLIFDDYEWPSPLGEDPLLRPGPAIDALLELVHEHSEVLEKSGQAILRKRPLMPEGSVVAEEG